MLDDHQFSWERFILSYQSQELVFPNGSNAGHRQKCKETGAKQQAENGTIHPKTSAISTVHFFDRSQRVEFNQLTSCQRANTT